jgi:SH3 domain protein
MRQGPLCLLLTALCITPVLHAEESQPLPLPTPAGAAVSAPPGDSATQIAALQQQLAESERQRSEQAAISGERETAQISRLRQDNQRLKLQLKQAQAEQPPRLLSEQQLWYVIGGGTALLAFVIGRLSAGGRNRRRSEWV